MILESLSNEPFIRIREPDGRIYERVQDIPAPVSWSAMVEAQHIRLVHQPRQAGALSRVRRACPEIGDRQEPRGLPQDEGAWGDMKILTIQDYETLITAIDGWIAGRPVEIMTDQMKDAVILKAWLILAKHELEDKERGKGDVWPIHCRPGRFHFRRSLQSHGTSGDTPGST